MLARVDQQAAGQQQSAGASRGDQHALGIDVAAVTLRVKPGNCLAQRGQPAGGGVTGVACGQCSLAGGHHGRSGGEVRLADFQVDDIVAGLFQCVGAGQQGHHMEGRDVLAAAAIAGHGRKQ